MVLLAHLDPDAGIGLRSELTQEGTVLDAGAEHDGNGERVADPQVGVTPDDGRAAAERHRALVVGEQVEAVALALDDLHARLDRHPVQPVGDLTEPAADAVARSAVVQLEPRAEPSEPARPAERVVEREDLARLEDDPIEDASGEADIGLLAALQRRLDGARDA